MRTLPRAAAWIVLALGFLAPTLAAGQEPDLSSAPRITVAELKALQASGGVIVLDVRDPDAYKEGHIPGARSIPLDEVERHAGELKTARKPIVTYCA